MNRYLSARTAAGKFSSDCSLFLRARGDNKRKIKSKNVISRKTEEEGDKREQRT